MWNSAYRGYLRAIRPWHWSSLHHGKLRLRRMNWTWPSTIKVWTATTLHNDGVSSRQPFQSMRRVLFLAIMLVQIPCFRLSSADSPERNTTGSWRNQVITEEDEKKDEDGDGETRSGKRKRGERRKRKLRKMKRSQGFGPFPVVPKGNVWIKIPLSSVSQCIMRHLIGTRTLLFSNAFSPSWQPLLKLAQTGGFKRVRLIFFWVQIMTHEKSLKYKYSNIFLYSNFTVNLRKKYSNVSWLYLFNFRFRKIRM